jgi:predicted secreted protein
VPTWTTKVNKRDAGSGVVITGETRVVGEDTANVVFPTELPLESAGVTCTINGSAATPVTSAPAAGQFRVHYAGESEGRIDFHASQNGATVVLNYTGTGSVLFSRDLNRLQADKADVGHAHSAADLTSGTLDDGRLSSNIPRLTAGPVFTGAVTGARTATTGAALVARLTTDSEPRWSVDAGGTMRWYNPTAGTMRLSANGSTLFLDDASGFSIAGAAFQCGVATMTEATFLNAGTAYGSVITGGTTTSAYMRFRVLDDDGVGAEPLLTLHGNGEVAVHDTLVAPHVEVTESITLAGNRVPGIVVSASPAPGSTSGYPDGTLWLQV